MTRTTREEAAVIVATHTPVEVPPCPVCGATLELGAMGGGYATWRCSSLTMENLVPIGDPGWKERSEHYSKSRFEQRLHNPDLPRLARDYLAALEALEAMAAPVALGRSYRREWDKRMARAQAFLRQVGGEE